MLCRRPVLLGLHRAVGSARDGPLREIVFGRSVSESLPNLSAVLSRRRVLGLQRPLPAVFRSVSTLFIFRPVRHVSARPLPADQSALVRVVVWAWPRAVLKLS